jgi:replication-associated recombination protein RarA
MSLLQTIHQGKKHSPPRIVLYGTEGIGKSTTAAQAPNTTAVAQHHKYRISHTNSRIFRQQEHKRPSTGQRIISQAFCFFIQSRHS